MILSGCSGAGKSYLVQEMISNLNSVMDRIPNKIYICYSRLQPLYENMKEASPVPVVMMEGLPEDFKPASNSLLIVDDLQGQVTSVICDWFTKNCHHYGSSVIYLIQNLFDKHPLHRTVSLNANYILIFNNPRDRSQVNHLARQAFANRPQVMIDAYQTATAKPHGYLIIDFKQTTPEIYRLRDNIIPEKSCVYVDAAAAGKRLDL